MTNTLATTIDSAAIESVVIGGDLSKLSPEQRVSYYKAVCDSIGLNPLTKPFDYINLNGRLTLYARKDAADQLRNINQVSIDKPDIRFEDDWIIVTVAARDKGGRTDSDVGVVNKKDMQGNFGNALMKAVTKAKRRVTLSICGLGMLDETEIETIPDAKPVIVKETGEIVGASTSKPQLDPGLDTLGAQLWPGGKWAEIKDKLTESVNAVGADVYATLQKRAAEIRTLDGLKAHVAKGWPGNEGLIDLLAGEFGDGFDRYAALQGIADAAVARASQPGVTDEQLVAVVLARLPEVEIPAEFK